MAAGMVGADVEQLRALAKRFDAAGSQLRQMSGTLTAQIQGTQAWQGGDAGRFRSEWGSRHRAQLATAADALHQAAQVVTKNAEEQQQASNGAGGSIASTASGATITLAELATGGFATGMAAKKLFGLFNKSKALTSFLKAAKSGGEGAEDALKMFLQGGKEGGLLGKLGLGTLGKLAGKAFLPLTVVTGLMDAVTGGGYAGSRGWATRGFGLAGAVGAGALMASSGMLGAGAAGLIALGPVGLGIAGGAVLAYGAWTAGNYIWDHREAIGHFFKGAGQWVGNAASSVGHAVGNAASSVGHAVGHAASNVGHAISSGVKHLIPHISIL